jgi:hypothetical protein
MFTTPFITSAFWSDAFTRCVRTFCQTLAAALGGSALNIWSASWHQAVGLAAGSAFLAILMTADRWTSGSSPVIVEPVAEQPVAFLTPSGGGCGDDLR